MLAVLQTAHMACPPYLECRCKAGCVWCCFILKTIMLLENSLEQSTRKLTGHVRSACFACWWRWEQRSLHATRKQTMEDLGARAGQVLSEQGLVPDVKGLYTIQCPSCRFALARTSTMMHCSCNSCASQQPSCQAPADTSGLGCPGWAGAGRAGPGARCQGALYSTVPS